MSCFHSPAAGRPRGADAAEARLRGTSQAPVLDMARGFPGDALAPRDLPLHLPAALQKGGGIRVMASYNEIDGVPSHANTGLLCDLLRKELGFQ